ncbi:hypothetical protein DRH14_02915 [Candidatus Shapirobacteria bacterium]|nr:MAG: hypothetical protein DRH14_02915 [Candidatus Shapirobacteria bacterium]
MKAYFTASLTGKKDFGANYSLIVKYLSSKMDRVFADHIIKADAKEIAKKQTKKESEEFYRKLLKKLKKVDVVVAEVSYSSLSVGYEISVALELGKPVVVLYLADRAPLLLEGNKNDKLLLVEYDEKSLEKVLDKVIEEARKKADVRFNFFVSAKILSYLDWVAKTKRIPRSVFLRNLIERQMKRDKDFRG